MNALTELEMRANEEARHAHRELVERLEDRITTLEELVAQLRADVMRLEDKI